MTKTYEEYSSEENCIKFADLGFTFIAFSNAEGNEVERLKKYLDGKYFLFGSPFSKASIINLFFEGFERFFDVDLIDTMISRNKVRATYNLYQIKCKE